MVAGMWAKVKGVEWGPSYTHAHGCMDTDTLSCVGLPVAIGNMNVNANTAMGTKLSGV